MTENLSAESLLWPRYIGPGDVAAIESVPLAARPGAHHGRPRDLARGLGYRLGPDQRRPDRLPAGARADQRLPYQQVRAITTGTDGSWHDAPPGQTGVLAISGPTVFPGYVTGHDGRGRLLDGTGRPNHGWLDTGDLARVGEEGFIYLAGRAKDLIIRGGHSTDPAVIEDALLAHPQVATAGAVARPDVRSGEVPVACVPLLPAPP